MSKINRLSLRQNFSWNFIGSLTYSFSQFIILIILTKVTNPEMVGLYSLGLAVTAPVLMLTNLQLRQIQATDTTDEYKYNDYFGLRIITGFVAFLIIIVLIYLSNYSFEKSIVIFLVGLSKIIDSYSDVVYGQLQQNERMDYIGKSRIIKGIITVVVFGASLLITRNLFLSLIMLNFIWFLIFWFYDQKTVQLYNKNISPVFNFKKLKRLVILAFPLGLVLMLGSLNNNLPRIVLEKLFDAEALGYFSAIAYILSVGNIFIQSVGQAASPRLAKLFKNRSYKEFSRIIIFLMILGAVIGLLCTLITIFFGEIILEIIYDASYANYNYLFTLIMFSGVFLFPASFLGYGITAMRLFKIQPFIGIFGLIVTLIFSLLLIPSFGLLGAVYTIIIGSFAQFFIRLLVIIFKILNVSKCDVKR